MVVDHAIVIMENVHRHVRLGKESADAVVDGLREVAGPVFGATLTTVAVFLPLMLMPGIIGAFMRIIPMVVTIALLASLFEALIILPSHIVEWSSPTHAPYRKSEWGQASVRLYSSVLRRVLRYRYWVVTAVLLCVVGGVILIPLVGVEMFREEDLGVFYVRVWIPPGTRLHETDRVLRQIEDIAMTLPDNEVEAVIATIGILEEDTAITTNSTVGQVIVELVKPQDRNRSVHDILADLRSRCQSVVGFERIVFDDIDNSIRSIADGSRFGWGVGGVDTTREYDYMGLDDVNRANPVRYPRPLCDC